MSGRDPAQQAERARRDAEIVRLRSESVPFKEIAERFSISHQRVYQIWQRTIKQLPVRRLEERRAEADQFCDVQIARMMELMNDPFTSARTKVEVSRTINAWEARRAALLGLDAPRRREVQTISVNTINSAILDMTREMNADPEYARLREIAADDE